MFVYTIQPVYCQTGCQTGLTTGCIVYAAGCQTGCTTRFDNGVERTVAVRSTRLSNRWFDNRLTTGWMFVYTIQPVVSPVVQPNRLYNRFVNRLYRVNGVLQFSLFGGLRSVTLDGYEYDETRSFVHVFTSSSTTFISRSLRLSYSHSVCTHASLFTSLLSITVIHSSMLARSLAPLLFVYRIERNLALCIEM